MPKETSNHILLFPLLLTVMIIFMGCNGNHASHEEESYICPMQCPLDSGMTLKGPGHCPVCKMDLVTMEEFEAMQNNESLHPLLLPADEAVVTNIRVTIPLKKFQPVSFNATGTIEYDTRNLSAVASRFSGRIEKLYLTYPYQPISKGQRLFDVYSPEIVTAQKELIFLLNHDSTSRQVIELTRQKLLLLGMNEQQIGQVIKTGKEFYALPVYSDVNGYLFLDGPETGLQRTETSSDRMNAMGQKSSKGQSPSPSASVSRFREGMYVQKGENVFNIIDPSKVWVVLKIDEKNLSSIKTDQTVSIFLNDLTDSTIKGKVDLIEPIYASGAVTMNTRIYLDNFAGKFRPGAWVNAHVSADSVEGLWIPRSAVLDAGRNKIAWVKDGPVFRATKVITGITAGNLIEIKDGLWEEDTLAAEAHFLTDSESLIKTMDDE